MRARNGSDRDRVRAGRRVRSLVALLSLFVQLAATAAHFHPEDFASLAADPASVAAPATQGAVPPARQPTLPAHDDCSLCFSLQIAGTSAMPAATPLPVPSGHGTAPPPTPSEIRRAASPHLLFQTRAPPIA